MLGFGWKDLFEKSYVKDDVNLPEPIETIYWQLILIGIFTVLGWYFDNVIPGAYFISAIPIIAAF